MIKSKKIAIVLVAFLSPCHSSPLFSTEARYIAFYAKSIRLIFLFLSFSFFFVSVSKSSGEEEEEELLLFFFCYPAKAVTVE